MVIRLPRRVIELPSDTSPITKYPGGPVDAPVAAAAKRLNATPTQVLLLWVRSKGVAIVTTSSTKEHLQEYLAVADLRESSFRSQYLQKRCSDALTAALTDDEIAAIDAAGAKGPPSDVLTHLRRKKYTLLACLLFDICLSTWLHYYG